MDGGKCLCMLRGVRPFLSAKYDITKHPRYKYLSDFNDVNTFDVGKYLARIRKPRPPVAPDEPFDFYDMGEPGDIVEIEETEAIGEIDAEPISLIEPA